jgi:ketosteroid isomerase-like protein
MKHTLAMIFGLLGVIAVYPSSAAAATEQEVRQMEEQRFEAMMKGDVATLDKLLADELTYTHASAQVDTKEKYLAPLKSGEIKIHKFDRSDIKVHVYGDAATITGEALVEVTVKGEDRKVHLRYADVWVKGNKGWQMVVWEATLIPEKK